ncbi:hypothetical protein SMD11_1246 [Streptomyces albireticuli]|uniref:Head-tail adaptor protein n=1 Tax=Streptomyces albireticuli TaxID=1940 RepID=A0A1Z2KXX9_9ACTN|nr:hypothetical protein SMD11_1246 [Streptomyces albireticuli]
MPRFGDPVEVYAAPLSDGVYTRSRDWASAHRVWAGLAHVQPDRSFEVRSPERETSQERLFVYLPWGVPVHAVDRIRYGGEWFEVDGEPMRWGHGSLRHVRIRAWRAMH